VVEDLAAQVVVDLIVVSVAVALVVGASVVVGGEVIHSIGVTHTIGMAVTPITTITLMAMVHRSLNMPMDIMMDIDGGAMIIVEYMDLFF
jgi:preprotein translocase subunit SecF